MKKLVYIGFILFFGVLKVHANIDSDRLSLREKIGQMLIMGFSGAEVNEHSAVVRSLHDDNIGGVILFDYNFQTKRFDKNIKSPEQTKQLNLILQQEAFNSNHANQRPQLPLLISVDYEGGQVNRLKPAYGFPETISAQAFSELAVNDAQRTANDMANTLKENGFNLDFAPVLDVNVNPENPVLGKLERSYSADPHRVIESSSLLANALKSQKIGCAYKHFPGHGSSKSDSHLGFVDVTESWQEYELLPYQALVSHMGSKDMIMTAHIVNRHLDASGLPATLSQPILTGLLRQKLGFQGVIITDDMQMKAISEHYGLEESMVLAINAGADMFIFGNQLVNEPMPAAKLIDFIEKNVRNGKISQGKINDSVHRITALKQAL